MKREIKFRVWDEEINHMIMNPLSFPEDYPLNDLMQYTGMKDKNGKEIYEGDIISDMVDTDEGLIKSHKQVFWNNKRGGWFVDDSYIQDKTEGMELWFELNDFNYEISGNIYENPELIEQTKNDQDSQNP